MIISYNDSHHRYCNSNLDIYDMTFEKLQTKQIFSLICETCERFPCKLVGYARR